MRNCTAAVLRVPPPFLNGLQRKEQGKMNGEIN